MFPLTSFGLFILFLLNNSGFPTAIKMFLVQFIHLKLFPRFDSFNIILYMSLERFVF